MKFPDLDSWLRWQESLHPDEIELGLDRVRAVYARLERIDPAVPVVTIGGTNGKGTCAAVMESVAREDGRRTVAYTSPHLFRYNERIRIDGSPVDDDRLVRAFEAVEEARGDIPLTYFEFGTLAALDIFARAAPDLVVLEVGLGGRLDAVNVVDPHVAVITSIGLDHTQWLGTDREAIGVEKAGILRDGIPLVLGEPDPPVSILRHARAKGSPVDAVGRDWDLITGEHDWQIRAGDSTIGPLPYGRLSGALVRNAACALRAYEYVNERRLPTLRTLGDALSRLTLPGRMQRIGTGWLVDLAHNPEGAGALAAELADPPGLGRTLAVFGMLADKDIDAVLDAMCPVVDRWFIADLDSDRGEPVERLRERLAILGCGSVSCHTDVASACFAARAEAAASDRIVAFGSFHVVAPTLEFLGVYSPAGHTRGTGATPR